MSYATKNFKTGDILYAKDLNVMDSQIQKNSTLFNDISDINGDISDLSGDISSINSEISNVKNRVTETENQIKAIVTINDADEIVTLAEKIITNADDITNLKATSSNNATNITNLTTTVSTNTNDISSLTEQLSTAQSKIEELDGIVNSTPKLVYSTDEGYRENEKVYYSLGDEMKLIFTFTSSVAGKCTVTILRNGASFKTFTSAKGLISVDLGTATTAGKYVYTVSAVDSIGRDSNTLTYTHIVGGVSLSSTFDNVISSTVFSSGVTNDITIPYNISYPEDGYTRTLDYQILASDATVVRSGSYTVGTSDSSSSFIVEDVVFPNPSKYTLLLTGKVEVENGTFLSSTTLSYTFSAIEANSIAVAMTNDLKDLTTNSSLYVTYRITTNIEALTISNGLAVRCTLYSVDDSGTESQIKSIRTTGITSGDTKTWTIGRLSNAGSYRIKVEGEPAGGADSSIKSQIIDLSVEIEADESIGSSYETAGLIAYFDPNDMDNDSSTPSVWKAKNSGNNNYYYFKLHNLNYEKNGWIVDDTDESKMLKFTGDSYGELRYVDTKGNDTEYSPMSEMTSSAMGNTLEIVFKSRCIGVSDAVVMSCRNESIDNYGGYTITYDKAIISSNANSATANLVEEKETHITFVLDKNIRDLGKDVSNTDIEDMNPVCTMNIYVNGVRTKVISMSKTEEFANSSAYPCMQLLLNAYKDVQNNTITGFGSCEIKTIRLYNVALKASQVINNYINSKYDTESRRALMNKNDSNKADIPVVRFVRNKVIDGKNVRYSKYSVDKSFATLNSITIKSSKDPTIATSKNSWVNCTVWYTYKDEDGLWQTVKYDDVDVYLQGTSSLQYPIKNYKIKIYNSSTTAQADGTFKRGKKKKIIPPNKSDKDGWHVKDAVFTLKCDYMEESHKNNTPTAMMYEDIVATVVDSVSGQFTPAKRDTYPDCYITYKDDEGNEVTTRKYRDAVGGFPILLYYNENDAVDSAGDPIDYNTLSTEENGYYVNDNDTMVGTLMWNIDKTGGSLGFEVDNDLVDVTAEDGTVTQEVPTLKVELPISGGTAKYTDGTDFELDIKPCISLEGTSNSSKPSAASFYTMEDANKYTYEDDYLTPKYNALAISDSYETFYTDVQDGKYSDVYTYEQYCELDDTGIFKDVYDYIAATFEARWVYTEEALATDENGDDKELDDDTYNELTFGHIKQTIDWLAETYNNKTRFRNEFSQHFNLAYCITYYLQMMMFIQVDNAGKNAMFDEWGDGVLYPRPYDMDTQMGENNSGDDVIHCSAEINRELSPYGITGTYAGQASASNSDTDASHTRYIDYNTPNSRLWIAFGNYFRTEIVAAYTKLRNDNVYTQSHIVETVNGLTSDIIGESFYNKDAAAKYLSQTKYVTNSNGTTSISDAMLTKLQGNRDSRYEQILQQRIIFLDTFFGYTQGDTVNTSLTIRSDAISAGTSNVQVGISVYSPCYITIQVGTDVTICSYIDLDSTYTYGANTYEGVLFNLPIVANNKDIIILGAGNIKSINHMENLVVTNFICENAKKITSIVITNSTALASLSLGTNIYLRTLNVSGSKTLSGSINLENCANLRYVNISDTNVGTVILPTGGDLQNFIAQNCKLTALSFNDLQFLSEVNIDGCTTIVSYDVQSCPLMTEINTAGWYNLNRLVVSDCANVTSLVLSNTKIAEMSITNCDAINSINLANCNGTIMSNLNLSTVYGLQTLNISGAQPTAGIVLYLPMYKSQYATMTEDEVSAAKSSGKDVYWHTLTSLNANSSTLSTIAYGVQSSAVAGTCDFGQLNALTYLNIQSCQKITTVSNLVFSGNISGMFYNCQYLTSVSGSLTSTSTSATSVFERCYRLSDISQMEFSMDKVTNANYFMKMAYTFTETIMKRILSYLPNVTSLYQFADMEGVIGSSYTSYTLTDKDLFINNPKVTTVQYCFCYSKITSVPSGLFDPFKSTLNTTWGCFQGCSALTTVPNNIIKECSNLLSTAGMFQYCTALKTFFTSTYDIFPTNSKITNTNGMFYNCYTLAVSIASNNASYGLKAMFNNLPSLQYCRIMFYNTRFITYLPETLFENNTKLIGIDSMFAYCTSLKQLPEALFTDKGSTVTTHPSLTTARGLFSNCTSCGGTINSKLFHGAKALTNLGHSYAVDSSLWGIGGFYTGGVFSNTAIIGYAHDFLSHLTNLTSVAFMFFHGTDSGSTQNPTHTQTNADKLSYVYIGSDSYPQRIYHDIFKGLTKLTDVRYCFAGNTSLRMFVDSNGVDVNENNTTTPTPNIFADCKGTLSTAEGLFAHCTNLEISVPSLMFQNCKRLTTLRACFANCISLNGTLPSDFLSGCTNLYYTHYMFYKCSQLGADDQNNVVSVPCNIFDSCRNTISNTSYMFAGCGFKGRIEAGTGTVDTVDGVTTYNVTKKGLLAECTNLYTVQGMFRWCWYLKGAIPEDMFFTVEAQKLYTSLTDLSYLFDCCYHLALSASEYGIDARNKLNIYGDDLSSTDAGYLVPERWLYRCPNISTINRIFNHVGHQMSAYTASAPVTGFSNDSMLLSDNTFSQQTRIQDAALAFAHVKPLAANLSSTFMQNSLNSLKIVEKMFAYSNLKSAGAQQYYAVFEKNSSTTAKNTTMTNMYALFYATASNGMTGYGPTMSRFTAVTSSNGMIYNQTGLTNYNTYTTQQQGNLQLWDDSDMENSVSDYSSNATVN